MPKPLMCRLGLHRWDRNRDETASEFLTCRRCGIQNGGDQRQKQPAAE